LLLKADNLNAHYVIATFWEIKLLTNYGKILENIKFLIKKEREKMYRSRYIR